eukprot:358801-Prorocentrum_lima.AAC.1
MTSSLVGSEMCIRDRPTRMTRSLTWHPGRGRPCDPGHEYDEAMRRAKAVSYTHLTLPTICSV